MHNINPAKISLAKYAEILQIVPPKEWSPRANFDNLNEFKITTPIEQYVNGAQGMNIKYVNSVDIQFHSRCLPAIQYSEERSYI